ncbi:MAG: hypothetical protein ACRED2_01585 [Methylocella sp.]
MRFAGAIEPIHFYRIFPPRGAHDPVEMLQLSRGERDLGRTSRRDASKVQVRIANTGLAEIMPRAEGPV